jgi:hypothetical protein
MITVLVGETVMVEGRLRNGRLADLTAVAKVTPPERTLVLRLRVARSCHLWRQRHADGHQWEMLTVSFARQPAQASGNPESAADYQTVRQH